MKDKYPNKRTLTIDTKAMFTVLPNVHKKVFSTITESNHANIDQETTPHTNACESYR
jgi:hypothetical protein